MTDNNGTKTSLRQIGKWKFYKYRYKYANDKIQIPANDVQMIEAATMKKKIPLRPMWASDADFVLTCIGFAIGVGNMLRFPMQVYKYRGGAFLLPYLIANIFLGTPILFLELSIGQFFSKSATQVFKMVPLVFGLGWTSTIVLFIVDSSYSIYSTWSMYYLVLAFRLDDPPFFRCDNAFNTLKCTSVSGPSKWVFNRSLHCCVLSTEEFYNYQVVRTYHDNNSIVQLSEPFKPAPMFVLVALLVNVIISCLTVVAGIRISGKIVYFTVVISCFTTFLLILASASLPGSFVGVTNYLWPDWSSVGSIHIYLAVIQQLVLSLGVGSGGYICLASFANFHSDLIRNTVAILIFDLMTSFLSGIAVFSIAGHMSYLSGEDFFEVLVDKPGVVFSAFPAAVAQMRWSNVWVIAIMITLISLSFDVQTVNMETLITAFTDIFVQLQKPKWKRFLFVVLMGILRLVTHFFFLTPHGLYVLAVIETRLMPMAISIITITECIAVGFLYNHQSYRRDVSMMLGRPLPIYWLVLQFIFVPITIMLSLLSNLFDVFISHQPIIMLRQVMPPWTDIVWSSLFLIVITPTILGFFYIIIVGRRVRPDLPLCRIIKLSASQTLASGPQKKGNWTCSKYYLGKLQILYPDCMSRCRELYKVDTFVSEDTNLDIHFRLTEDKNEEISNISISKKSDEETDNSVVSFKNASEIFKKSTPDIYGDDGFL